MENYKSIENLTLNTNQYTPGDSKPIDSTEESADVDYKLMAKIIDKQLTKSSRAHVKELQKQFNRFSEDNKKNFDRLSRENGRLLKIVEDLQSSQRHLQHQLELHQEREKLAVLREQQDVKRIRDLEDRLSLLLLPPVQNNQISLDDPNRSEVAIQPAEIVEIVEEVPEEVFDRAGAPEDFPDIESSEVVIKEDFTQQSTDSSPDTDKQFAGPLSGLETDDDLSVHNDMTEKDAGILSNNATAEFLDGDYEEPVKTSPLLDDDQSKEITVEATTEKSQTADEEGGEYSIESPGGVQELSAEPFAEREYTVETDSDQEPGGLDGQQIEAGEEELDRESETVVDGDMPEPSPLSMDHSTIPDGDEWVQPDSYQIEEGFAESGHVRGREDNGTVEEPTTEEIETVGEIPPMGIVSTPAAVSITEDSFDPIEEDRGAVITDGESAEGDIIELQDEISLEKPGIEIDDHESTIENAVSEVDVELPGMQLESDMVVAVQDSVETGHPSETDGDGHESDDDVDTGTFEIIELHEENIVSSLTATEEDFQLPDMPASATEGPADYFSAEVPGAPPADRLSGRAKDEDLTSENSQELFKRGKFACESKDYSQAAVYFDRFVELVPDEPRGHYNLALLYYRLKNYPAARTHAEHARALDYAPVDKIMRKIKAKMGDNMGQHKGQGHAIEETGPDDPFNKQTAFGGVAGTPFDDETVVYEPDILPHFNIDLSKSELEDDSADEPYDLLSVVKDNSPESGLSEIEIPEKTADEVIETNTIETNDSAAPATDIELPGMEQTDDGQPEIAISANASTQEDLESEVPYIMEWQASDSEGATLEDTVAETESGYPLYNEGYDALAEYLPDTNEDLTEDAVETLEVNKQGRTKTNDNDASVNGIFDLQEIKSPVEERPAIVDPSNMNGQEENLFEPPSIDPALEKTTPDEPIEPLLSEGNNLSEAAASEPLTGERSVDSSEETIPASQHFSLAMAASRQKDYPEAIACFEKYIEQLPDEPKGHYNLAILYYRRNEYDKASQCASRALQLGAKPSQKIIDKIESKLSLEESEDRHASGDQSLNKRLDDNLNFPITELGNPAGEDDTASIWDADELDGDISPSLIAEAATENSFGTNDDVIVFNSTIAPVNDGEPAQNTLPEDKPSLDELKISALRRSASRESKESDDIADEAAVHSDSDIIALSETGRVNNLFKLGQKAIESNEFLKAIKHFTKVTHLLPEDPRGYYYLAVVSCRLKFFETAREHATHAIELGSEPAKKILEEITAHQATA